MAMFRSKMVQYLLRILVVGCLVMPVISAFAQLPDSVPSGSSLPMEISSGTGSSGETPVNMTNVDKAFPGVLKQFEQATKRFNKAMIGMGIGLLFSLATLQMVWTLGWRGLKGQAEVGTLLADIIKILVMTLLFFTFIAGSSVFFQKILDEWHRIGGIGAGTGTLDPGGLMLVGLNVVSMIGDAFATKVGSGFVAGFASLGMVIQVVLAKIFVLLCFILLAGQMAMAMIKGYMWLCVGPIIMGFAGLKSTRDIAINTLKAGISIGGTLLTIYVIAGVAIEASATFGVLIQDFSVENFGPIWAIVAVSALLALAAWQVPKFASDFINGTISTGVGEAAGAAVAAAAGVAAAAPLIGGAAGAAANVGTAGLEQLGGVMKAAGSAMASAADHGKTGLDAVAHAAGEMAGGAASVFNGRFDMASKAVGDKVGEGMERLNEGVASSFGGKVADHIESQRGGTMSGIPGASGGAPDASSPKEGTGGSPSGSGQSVRADGEVPSGSTGGPPISGELAPSAGGSMPGQPTVASRGDTIPDVPGASGGAPDGRSPNVGTGGAPSGSGQSVGTDGDVASGSTGGPPIGGNVALTPNADGSMPGQTTIDSSAALGNASGASLEAGGGGKTAEQKIDEIHDQLTKPGEADPLHKRIQALQGYIPANADQPVGVNANLGGGGGEE